MSKIVKLAAPQQHVEAIIKAAADLGMGGFALAKLRTAVTDQIEPMVEALRPFAIEATSFDGMSNDPDQDFAFRFTIAQVRAAANAIKPR